MYTYTQRTTIIDHLDHNVNTDEFNFIFRKLIVFICTPHVLINVNVLHTKVILEYNSQVS